MSKIQNEKYTIKVMIELYCKKHHAPSHDFCESCLELYNYALNRLDKCPYKEDKPICEKCTIHCYKPDKREQVRQIMRYAGPKMIFHHPVLAIQHIIKKLLSK